MAPKAIHQRSRGIRQGAIAKKTGMRKGVGQGEAGQ